MAWQVAQGLKHRTKIFLNNKFKGRKNYKFDTNASPFNNFCLLYLPIFKELCGRKQNLVVFIFRRAYRTIFVLAVVVMTVGTFFGQSVKARQSFVEDKSFLIENNVPRLSYGVAVSDFNNDGNYELVVTTLREGWEIYL